MRPVKSADDSKPESMSATVTPLPVQVLEVSPRVPRSAAGFGAVAVVPLAVRSAISVSGLSVATWSPCIAASNEMDSTRGSAASRARSSSLTSALNASMKS